MSQTQGDNEKKTKTLSNKKGQQESRTSWLFERNLTAGHHTLHYFPQILIQSYTHRQSDRKIERQRDRDREGERERDTQTKNTHTHTPTQTHTHTHAHHQ